MPQIQFDVLLPGADAEELRARFAGAGEKLAAAGVLDALRVEATADPAVGAGVAEQLSQTYRRDHHGRDLEDGRLWRYRLHPEGFTGSLNQLAMALSRLLTPGADLPDDPVALENERAHELPARYPWTVEVSR